jgi:hypothetical protein
MKLFKTRNVIEMLTRPATEEERRGERNSKYLGYLILLAIVGVFLYGCWSLVQKVIS